MTIGSAASRPSGELGAPQPTFHPLESAPRRRVEPALLEESDSESEIWYPTAPQTVSWPRVFPQL
jgi:hypothetical protein